MIYIVDEPTIKYEGSWDTDRLRALYIELKRYRTQTDMSAQEATDELLGHVECDYRAAARHENGE